MKTNNLEKQIENIADSVSNDMVIPSTEEESPIENTNVTQIMKPRDVLTNSVVGLNIDVVNGWYPLNREEIFGKRNIFYPYDWKFKIHGADVKTIKNFSIVDEEDISGADDAINDILRACLRITDGRGELIPLTEIHDWDRIYLLLKIRELTSDKWEKEIKFDELCVCETKVYFEFSSDSIHYTLPDEEIINKHWKEDEQCWEINPLDYGVEGQHIKFYPTTIGKVETLKVYINALKQRGKIIPKAFLTVFPYMMTHNPKTDLAFQSMMSDCEDVYNKWNADQFELVQDIIKNIQVTPKTECNAICEHCGMERVAEMRFPGGLRGLFTSPSTSGRKKFGSK